MSPELRTASLKLEHCADSYTIFKKAIKDEKRDTIDQVLFPPSRTLILDITPHFVMDEKREAIDRISSRMQLIHSQEPKPSTLNPETLNPQVEFIKLLKSQTLNPKP
jgi:hypothetical protein